MVIFCEKQGDVDDIHEYLLLRTFESAQMHNGNDQLECNEVLQLYKDGKKDDLVVANIAAKGLHFSDTRLVISFDVPTKIEKLQKFPEKNG